MNPFSEADIAAMNDSEHVIVLGSRIEMSQIDAERDMDESFLRNPLMQKRLFNKLRRYGDIIRLLVFPQFPLYHLRMDQFFFQAKPAIFFGQYLSLVKHVAGAPLQDGFGPQPTGAPQRIERTTAQPHKDIAGSHKMPCRMTVI